MAQQNQITAIATATRSIRLNLTGIKLSSEQKAQLREGLEVAGLLDSVRSKTTPEDFTTADELASAALGEDYDPKRFEALFKLIEQEGWSAERLYKATLFFCKFRSKWKKWSFQDWWDYTEGKVYDKAWKDKLLHERYAAGMSTESIMADLEGYLVNGEQLWRLADLSNPLPFERFWPIDPAPAKPTPELPPADPVAIAQIISDTKAALSSEDTASEGG